MNYIYIIMYIVLTYEEVEFEVKPVEVGDFGRITVCFRGIYRTYLK